MIKVKPHPTTFFATMFKVQKQYLVSLADNPPAGQLANVELIDGIIHLMDYIQDEFAPEEIND